MKIHFEPIDKDCYSGSEIEVSGEDIQELIVKFIEKMNLHYGKYWISPNVLEAITEIHKQHDEANLPFTFEHRDFSAPEEQFDLTISD